MSDRFQNLKKIPEHPAARLLAHANAKIETKLKSPANASVPTVLAELEEAEAWVDLIRVLSVCLPPRECVWWSCIAAQDIVASEDCKSTCLAAAEAWVFEPTEENRARLHTILENESADDPAALAATAAFYAPGTMGLGEMEEHAAPPGIVSACAFGTNLQTLKLGPEPNVRFQLIIDRALDIARGGNGKVELPEPESADDAENGSETAPKIEGTA